MGRKIYNWCHAHGMPKINLEYFPSIYIYDILFGAFSASWSMFRGCWNQRCLSPPRRQVLYIQPPWNRSLSITLIFDIRRRWCGSPALPLPLSPRSGGGATAAARPDGGRVAFFRLKQFRKQVAIAFVKMEIPSAKIIFADGTNIRLQKSCIFVGLKVQAEWIAN